MSSTGIPFKESALIIPQTRNNSLELSLDSSSTPTSPRRNENWESSFRSQRILEKEGGNIFSSSVSHLLTTSVPSVSIKPTQPTSFLSINQVFKLSKPTTLPPDPTVSPESPSSTP